MAILQPSILLDPKENYVGNTVPWDQNFHCPFCGGTTGGGCKWSGNYHRDANRKVDYSRIKMRCICTKVAAGTAPAPAPTPTVKVPPLSAVVAPAKPLVNCPLCGAYAADKHRRGCKSGGIQ